MSNDIPFPWDPYPQQKALMEAILAAIDTKSIALLESPTGTGKSLSTICSSLYWLYKEEKRIIDDSDSTINDTTQSSCTNDDWLVEMLKPKSPTSQAEKKITKIQLDNHKSMKAKLKNVPDSSISHKDMTVAHEKRAFDDLRSTSIKAPDIDNSIPSEEQQFIMDPYDSDNKSIGDSDHESDSDEDYDYPFPQILYCSRTHSQISQFVGEIKRSSGLFDKIRCISLASRKNLCINDDLKSVYTSDTRLSEACLDLQKNKPKKSSDLTVTAKKRNHQSSIEKMPCKYHSKSSEYQFSLHALGRIRDIEELVSLGTKLHACPYYSTRKSIKHAQIVCMPYSMLLHEELRKSMGINIKGRVIIFDEAHNVVDTINQLFSADISMTQIETALSAITMYYTRFQTVLHGKNMYYVSLLRSAIQKLLTFCKRRIKVNSNDSVEPELQTANSFIFNADIDNINLVKLSQYINVSNLINRIGGFADHQHQKKIRLESSESGTIRNHSTTSGLSVGQQSDNATSKAYTQSIRIVITFLRCLMSADVDGRVLIDHRDGKRNSLHDRSQVLNPTISLKYVLFNPSHHFQTIVDQARSVILLGGTLKPFPLLTNSLFPNVSASRIQTFSCDHVIPQHHVAPYVVPCGHRNISFEFTFEKRYNPDMLHEFYNLLNDSIVPNIHSGVIVFFSSYGYMDYVIDFFKRSSLFDALHARKPIFIEPHSTEEGERLLDRYSTYANTKLSEPRGVYGKGAILFCVMGGKLSEGINFSDDLARCVIVVGLPYPDLKDPILQERMKYANSLEGSATAGKRLYEAICMRQVNQSIGRSIRHRNDYASIILLDKRYEQPNIIAQLPSWISRSLKVSKSVNELGPLLGEFIRRCKEECTSI